MLRVGERSDGYEHCRLRWYAVRARLMVTALTLSLRTAGTLLR